MNPDDSTLPDRRDEQAPEQQMAAATRERMAAETRWYRTRSWDDWGAYADARRLEVNTALALGFAVREPVDVNLERDFEVDDNVLWGLW
jgi:hypothetical protein